MHSDGFKMQRTGSIERVSAHGWANRLYRATWTVVWMVLFVTSPKPLHWWRRWILRVFGAEIGRGAVIHSSVKIWAPNRLTMEESACLGPNVDCYNVGGIVLGCGCVVSQYSYLCGAGHDYGSLRMPLVPGRISVGRHAWIGADVFVGPGVSIGAGAVVGARSSVFSDIEPWVVAVGSPARAIKVRVMNEGRESGRQ